MSKMYKTLILLIAMSFTLVSCEKEEPEVEDDKVEQRTDNPGSNPSIPVDLTPTEGIWGD